MKFNRCQYKVAILLVILGLVSFAYVQNNTPQNGKASYYSDKLHGRKTASGVVYDKNKYTAAHRTYPFGTLLEVTNLSNNKSVIVEVIDRGPYSKERLIDLSKAAAKDLDMIQAGICNVSIRIFIPDTSITMVPVDTLSEICDTIPILPNMK